MRVNSPVHSCGYSRSLAQNGGLLRSLFASFRKTVTTSGIEAESEQGRKGRDSGGIQRIPGACWPVAALTYVALRSKSHANDKTKSLLSVPL